MKSPLMYQMTERDCGVVSVYNAISFLFDRDEMPLEFLNIMASYSIGCYDEEGNLSNKEFCDNILFFASSWIEDYAKEKHISLRTKHLLGRDVNLLEIRNCLLAGGSVSLKTKLNNKNHFVTITKMDNNFIYIFDPYYKTTESYSSQLGIEVILDKPFYYNRKVKIENFIQEKSGELMLGDEDNREAVLFYRKNAVMQREFT